MFQKVMEAFGASRFAAQRSTEEEPVVARMSVERVHKFSSQYGGENSRGYTAGNVSGDSCNYPNYGDFSEACVMRTYGSWWSRAPSAQARIGCTEPWFIAEDFIDLCFSTAVYPERIDIYETYNPGAVVRILACNKAPHQAYIYGELVQWEVLWSGPPVKTKPNAVCFSPTIKKPSFPTRLVRIELNQSLCDYYTELDAVYLTGTNSHDNDAMKRAIEKSVDHLNVGAMSLRDSKYSPENSKDHDANESSITERVCCGSFQVLPDEVISYVLSFLTFKEFGVLAQCCRFFRFLCYDPVWYKELNLKPFWSRISDNSLEAFIKRCGYMEKFDSSWIGPLGLVSASVYNRFITSCGSLLTNLRLSACEFLNKDIIDTIANTCSDLIELNLSSCDFKDPEDLAGLKALKKLRILNLYRVPICDASLVEILKNSKDLEFLNIGSNIGLENGNVILEVLSANCKKLRGLDMWRCRSVDDWGVERLCKSCTDIEELDFGWCSNIKSYGSGLTCIAENLRNLKKLFLTAVRGVNNDDVDALANFSSELEQFDMLGTGNVKAENVYRLLQRCRKLKLLDVSFCNAISSSKVQQWRQEFPNVSIKKSFAS